MRCLFLVPLITLAGCAGQAVNAPSLLPRPIETRSDAETVADTPVPPDPALDANIQQRASDVDKAVAAFDTVHADVARRIARGSGAREGSEAWLDRQQALGELQQAGSAIATAMTELEALAITRASAGQRSYPALDAAIATAQADLDRRATIEADLRTGTAR